MKKEQHLYLNILKSIAIIIICLIHFSNIYGGEITQRPYIFSLDSIRQFLYNIISIAIPLFFMVNGALLLNKNCDYKYVIKKIIHLIIQFIRCVFITLLIISIHRGITSNNFNISNFIGTNTITVYYLHWILGYTILESIQPFLPINKGIIYSITISIILTIICSAIGYLIKKIPFINKII